MGLGAVRELVLERACGGMSTPGQRNSVQKRERLQWVLGTTWLEGWVGEGRNGRENSRKIHRIWTLRDWSPWLVKAELYRIIWKQMQARFHWGEKCLCRTWWDLNQEREQGKEYEGRDLMKVELPSVTGGRKNRTGWNRKGRMPMPLGGWKLS